MVCPIIRVYILYVITVYLSLFYHCIVVEKLSESSFKKKKKAKQKAQAGNGCNWNTLFLGQNAVVDAMASQYRTSKSAILDPESHHSSAVTVALGETQLVTETQQFLESSGVDLSCFGSEKKQSRSKTVILAKNLPFGTTADELAQLFSTFGELDQVILPPAGVTAIVKFFEPQNAKNAWNALQYTKFKHLPLYLEAPVVESKPNNSQMESDLQETKLLVRNIPFEATSKELKEMFGTYGELKSLRLPKR